MRPLGGLNALPTRLHPALGGCRPQRASCLRGHSGISHPVCAVFNPAAIKKQTPVDAGVVIPLNFAQLLGLKGRDLFLDPQISAAYEDLLAAPLDEAFSSVARLGREKLLFAARDGLRAARGRVPLLPFDVTIEPLLLPGAVALLEQSGMYEAVIQLAGAASEALRDSEFRQNTRATLEDFRRDVALATALAHCGLAKGALDAGRPAAGCSHLEEALAGLREGGTGAAPLAAALQERIVEALQDLKPDAVLDYLKSPFNPEEIALRRQAVAALAHMLQDPPKPGSPTATAITADYASHALSTLTSAELVGLLSWERAATDPASFAWWYPKVLLHVGTAYLVAGFRQRRPALVASAARLLYAGRAENDVAVHVAVCEVLLGQPHEALDTLQEDERLGLELRGQKGGRAAAPRARRTPSGALAFPDRDGVMGFVRAACPEEAQDLLPGLCLFAEQWMRRMAFPAVRDTREAPPAATLADYFEDPQTESYLDSSTSKLSLAASPSGAAHLGRTAVLTLLAMPARAVAALGQVAVPRQLARAAGLVLLAGAVVAAQGWQRSGQRESAAAAVAPAATAATVRPAVGSRGQQQAAAAAAVQTLSKAEAERLIKRWLEVKAEAMGPRHQTIHLPSVLAPPMLQAVTSEAKEAATAGWFWNIRPLRCWVDSVDASELTQGGGHAVVMATVDESADLWATNGKKGDAYKTTYRVEYTVVRGGGGGWRVASALVLGK